MICTTWSQVVQAHLVVTSSQQPVSTYRSGLPRNILIVLGQFLLYSAVPHHISKNRASSFTPCHPLEQTAPIRYAVGAMRIESSLKRYQNSPKLNKMVTSFDSPFEIAYKKRLAESLACIMTGPRASTAGRAYLMIVLHVVYPECGHIARDFFWSLRTV